MPGEQPNFDLIARPYRWLEYLALGPVLQRTRTHHLPLLNGCRQALILGDGDGRFTAAFMARNAQVYVDAVDLSPAMLALLRGKVRRVGGEARLQAHCTDARTFTPGCSPDLIVTHFFLDCLTQPEVDALVGRIARRLTPGGLWLVSDFRVPDGVLRWPARIYIRLLYLIFRIVTGLRVTRLPDFGSALKRAGLRRVVVRRSLFGVLTTELWQWQPGSELCETIAP